MVQFPVPLVLARHLLGLPWIIEGPVSTWSAQKETGLRGSMSSVALLSPCSPLSGCDNGDH